jgi:quinol monooxygenase YgiN
MILLLVKYSMKPGSAEAFLSEAKAAGIPEMTRNEEGNIKYEFYYPADKEDTILLLEQWIDFSKVEAHRAMDHVKSLIELKNKYVLATDIQRFDI